MPSYINWTKFSYQNPQTKIILSLGGASFSSVWSNMTSSKISSMVTAIKEVLTTSYPVFSGNFAKSGDLLGYTEIDGIELDVELGGARMSSDISNQVG